MATALTQLAPVFWQVVHCCCPVLLRNHLLFPWLTSTRGARFHFWDATDDISGAHLDLVFERDQLYLHNARGAFGAVPMTLTGALAAVAAGLGKLLRLNPLHRPASELVFPSFKLLTFALLSSTHLQARWTSTPAQASTA